MKYSVIPILLLLAAARVPAQTWIWPISGSITPDEMNTSFGPRINYSKRDFHDGVDLPAATGAPVLAVADGTVEREGPGGTDGYSSRHVVLNIFHPVDGVLRAVYLHLDSIAPGIYEGLPVTQGTLLGTVGADDATYSHLHFEVRRGGGYEINSVHPLHYLPYTDSANFTAPVLDRVQAQGAGLAARLAFTAPSKLEGDLRRVDVDLREGEMVLEARVVDLDDKTTIREGNGDGFMWTHDIAVEGYQSSDMVADGRTDLHYGVLVRNLPPACDNLVARVIDCGGNTSTGGPHALSVPAAFHEYLTFEDGAFPAGWSPVTSSSGTGTTLLVDATSALEGSFGLHATDTSTTEMSSQTASLERALPGGRLEWTAEGLFHPVSWGLGEGQNAYLLYFRNGTGLSAAASARNNSGTVQTGIVVKNPDASITSSFSTQTPAPGTTLRWTLDVFRLGTRETTAVLYINGQEAARKTWDGRTYEPDGFRGGLGFTSVGAVAEVHADEVRLDDGGLASLPSFLAGRVQGLRIVKSGTDLDLAWGPSCSPYASDYAVMEGTPGDFTSHVPRLCTTDGSSSTTLTPGTGDRYYLVVPLTAAGEGSYGQMGSGAERPPTAVPCTDRAETPCP